MTAFASNVARLDTIAHAAKAHGRKIALVGRSMHKIVQAARDTGYLKDFPPVLDEAEAAELPARKVLYLCTGSQGEPRAALARIAEGNHPDVQLGKGDAVIFSSRIIPGNEIADLRAAQQAVGAGRGSADRARIISSMSPAIPARDELAQMYRWTRPRIAVPVHGEMRHMAEHARLAKSLQVPEALVPANGQLYRLAPGPRRTDRRSAVGPHPSGRPGAGGGRRGAGQGPPRHGLCRADRHHPGAGRQGPAGRRPAILVEGMPEPVRKRSASAVEELLRRTSQEAAIARNCAENVRRAARRAAQDAWGKKPVTRVTGESETSVIGKTQSCRHRHPDLEKAAALYRDTLGAKVSAPVAQPEHGVTTVFVELPGSKIELLAPLGENSPIANFLTRNPEGGMHHLCFEVDDIIAARDRLAGARRAAARARRNQDRRPWQARAVPASQRLSAAR